MNYDLPSTILSDCEQKINLLQYYRQGFGRLMIFVTPRFDLYHKWFGGMAAAQRGSVHFPGG